MKKTLTLFLMVILSQMATHAQDYEDLLLEDESFGTIQTLTTTDVEVTSAGFRGNAGDYNGRYAIVVGDLYFFTASTDAAGDELWVTDGTREGTSMVMDIQSGSGSSAPSNFVAADGNLYFVATTEAAGTELWVSDGTAAGTTQVFDLFEGSESSSPNTLTPFAGGLLFAALSESNPDNQHLWHYDFSTQTVERLSANNEEGVVPKTSGMDAHEGLSHFQLIGDTLAIFGGTTSAVGEYGVIGEEIWVTNGEPEPWGTKMLLDINESDNSNIQWLLAANEKQVVFRARTPGKWNGQPELTTLDNEYWVTDGTTKGTYLLDDYNAASGSEPNTTGNTQAAFPIAYGGKLVFRGDGGFGRELAIVNSFSGEAGSVELLWDISPFRDGAERVSDVDDLIIFDDRLFFKANINTATPELDINRVGQELAAYDITTDERLLVAEIFPGQSSNSFPRNKTIVNGRMYMTANDAASQGSYDIWVVDIKGDGQDPEIDEVNDFSNLPDDYIVYKLFNDVDGATGGTILKQSQSDLRDLNGNLVFVTKSGMLAIYDDGLEKTDESTNSDGIDDGLPVEIGENDVVNAPPVVTIAGPDAGSTFVEADPVVFTANAEDPEGVGVIRVEYYEGDFFNSWNLLGTAVSADDNFAFTWTAVPSEDPQTITALAYDANDSAFSTSIEILVTGNTPPTVSITLPTEDQDVVTGTIVPISVDANDDNLDGVVSVEFFANDESIFFDEEFPYGFEWTAPEELGEYIISAVATDILDATTTSGTITITIIEEPLSVRASEEYLSIYPVPTTNGLLNFKNNFGEKLNISITDLSGKSVYKTVINNGIDNLSVDEFEAGIYTIRVERPSTNQIFTYKVVFE